MSESESYKYPASRKQLSVVDASGKIEALRQAFQNDREAASAQQKPSIAETDTFQSIDDPNLAARQREIHGKVVEVIRTIYDPEIPVNLYDLGLIYAIDVREDDSVHVKMTLTAPACPVAGTLPPMVENHIENIPEVRSATVELVWDPPWTRDRMSEAALLELGLS